MMQTLTRAEALRIDLDNLHFARRYYIGILAELEQLGRTHTKQYRDIERGVRTLSANIKKLEYELLKAEEEELLS